MFAPTHNILTAQSSGTSGRRLAIIGSVALLHVLVVYAIVTGMAQKIVAALPTPITIHFDQPTETKTTPPPLKPVLVQPAQPLVTAVKPDIQVAPEQSSTFDVPLQPPTPAMQTLPNPVVADTVVAGLAATHTIPPYPALENKLGHQGTVLLQLAVSAEGTVTSATVLTSSGYDALDQAAVAWVTAHWRYKPAVKGGVAVPSTINAAVKFDLHQARG